MQGASSCLCPIRHWGTSGRSELKHWQLTYGDLSPVQLRFRLTYGDLSPVQLRFRPTCWDPSPTQLQFPLAHLLLREINFPSHVEILLRNPAGRVSAERAGDFRVADIDVGVMVRRLGRFGYRRYKADSGQEIPELKRLGNRVSAPAPAREIAELSLDRNVG